MSNKQLNDFKNINIETLNDYQILKIFDLLSKIDQQILDTELKSFQSNLIHEGINRGLFKIKKGIT